MKPKTIILSAACLCLAACGSSDGSDNAAAGSPDNSIGVDEGADVAAAQSGAPDAAAPLTAQAFADAVAASDRFEIESANLAAKMAKDPAVKSFAEMMVSEHTKSTADLKAAAAKVSPPVRVAAAMTAEQEAGIAQLEAASDRFDQIYAQKQVMAHQKALTLLQSYATSGDSPPLRDFAAKTATVVSRHLEQAQRLPR
jgi:putative membrane protein